MRTCCISDKGPVRSENQDRGAAVRLKSPRCSILVVCDGMGGANSGSLASTIAMETYLDRIKRLLAAGKDLSTSLPQWMQESCAAANAAVFERGSNPAHAGMGTTLVSAVVKGRTAEIINVGDSRAYLIRGRKITCITRDHSVVAELVASGSLTPEEAAVHPNRNMITRAVGVEPAVEPDGYTLRLRRGDRLLLCSDGLSNTLTETELFSYARCSRDAAMVCQALIDLAVEKGARDNVTAAVAIY